MRWVQAKALIWELWARNRVGLVITLIGVPASLMIAQRAEEVWPQLSPFFGMVKLLAVWSVAYLVMIFSYADFSPKSLQTGFPRHVLKLPLPTWMLVAVPMGIAVVTVFGFATVLVSLLEEQTKTGLDFLLLLVAAIIAMSWMQTVNWGLNRTPMRAALVIIAVVAATGICLVSTLSISLGPVVPFWVGALGLGVLAVAGVALATWSVTRIRSGQTFGQTIFWSDYAVPGFAMRKNPSSGTQAQFWYEWRVFGSALPLASVFFGGLLFFVQFLPSRPQDVMGATSMVVAMFWYIGALLGFELSKSHLGAGDHRMSGFWAVRPLSSPDLAFAKLKVAAYSIGLSTVICFVPLVAAWTLTDQSSKLMEAWALVRNEQGSVGASVALVLAAGVVPLMAWILCGNVLALSLFGSKKLRRRIVVGGIVALLTITGLAIYGISQLADWRQFLLDHYAGIFGVFAVLVAIGFVLFLRAFGKVASLGLLRFKMATTGVVAALALGGTQLMDGVVGFPWGFVGLTVCLSLLSLYPWVVAPIALQTNRHR